MSKVIWQKAASMPYQPSWLQNAFVSCMLWTGTFAHGSKLTT